MKAHTLYFSPTHTGATVAKAIQKGLVKTELGDVIDLTYSAVKKTFGKDDVVIVAMPIYSGRIPLVATKRFKAIQGNGAKVIAVAIYGNANVGDALLELTQICTQQGFVVIAAATFIGEHSFTMAKFPIAVGRPDAADLKKAELFASLIQEKLDAPGPFLLPTVPGTEPYAKEAMNPPGVAATGTDLTTCIRCGLCKTACPTHAITLTDEGPQTDDAACIWCGACVKVCNSHARIFTLPKITEIAERLYTTFQERKEPEWFFAQPSEA